ncbi:ferredoxin-NADP reductase, partial [Candidatus Woesearchaeota archaeon CG08_land_8_20_14_0_20_43_7]
VFWEEKMKTVLDELYVATNDGSYGMKGFVTDALAKVLEHEKVDRVIAIGPPVMMRAVADLTREKNIKTIASINSIMIDGIGMCGVCRVEVAGETKFACYDGPDFDAHEVNWDLLLKRNSTYAEEEKLAYAKCLDGDKCH